MIEPANSARQYTVLVVDDMRSNVALLADILGQHYRVLEAGSGESALAIMQSDSPPDLVLLDVRMPGMDGYEVMRRVRMGVRTRDIPVLFVSSMSEAVDEEVGLELGAVDYLTKPVNSSIILARVRNHLALSERTRMLRQLSDKLSHYLSPQIYQMIFQGVQDATVPSQRKKLTIFFSDLKDFTQTTESLPPEDLTRLLNSYLSEMSDIALEYGATIDKYVGDAMVMFFGDPESLGTREDAERAQ